MHDATFNVDLGCVSCMLTYIFFLEIMVGTNFVLFSPSFLSNRTISKHFIVCKTAHEPLAADYNRNLVMQQLALLG
jgi:hypothetical protein